MAETAIQERTTEIYAEICMDLGQWERARNALEEAQRDLRGGLNQAPD